MNRKQLITALTIGVVLTLFCIYIVNRDASAWKEAKVGDQTKLFPALDVNSVQKITLTNATNHVTIAKSNDKWIVLERDGYPANFKRLSDALIHLTELQIAQTVVAGPSQYGRLELLDPVQTKKPSGTGTLLQLMGQGNEKLASLVIGKQHVQKQDTNSFFGATPNGRYLLPSGPPKQPVLVAATMETFTPRPADWLDKDLPPITDIKTVTRHGMNGTQGWQLSRDTQQTSLALQGLDAKNEDANTSAIASIATSLEHITFDDVLTGELKKAFKPSLRLDITTFDDITYTLQTEQQGTDYLFTITAKADLSHNRSPAKMETKGKKKQLDSQFSQQLAKTKQQLETVQALQKYVFKTTKQRLNGALKSRKDLVTAKKKLVKPTSKTTQK